MSAQPAERDLFAARRLLADFYGCSGRLGSSLDLCWGRHCRPATDDGLCTAPDMAAIADAVESLWQEAKRRDALESAPARP